MAEQPNDQYENESAYGPAQQHQESDGNKGPIGPRETKTITNICYDCLERIFDFLDLESLVNVAGTCKRL